MDITQKYSILKWGEESGRSSYHNIRQKDFKIK